MNEIIDCVILDGTLLLSDGSSKNTEREKRVRFQ